MSNTYDQTPYPRHAYGFTHPDRLATLATLRGLEPPEVARARILEVGCARGANLVPMAYAMPEAELIGIDLSGRQIAEAREFAEGVGLKNVRFEQIDLAELSDSFGSFDYIIAHGVYSWVPPEIGQALLQLCGRRLVENGVALISYNTYPGCHLRQMVRAMGQFHTRGFDEPQQRVEQLHAMMHLLVQYAPDDGSAYKRILRGEADRLSRLSEEFVLHDMLEDANYPVYLHEFVDRAEASGLQYVCDAMPAEQRRTVGAAALEKLGADFDPIELEQHLDFLDGTSFRRSIVCRRGQALLASATSHNPAEAPLEKMLLATPAQPISAAPDLDGNRPEEFVTRKNRLTASLRCDRPIEKMSLAVLGEIYPAVMSLERLLNASAAKLGRTPTAEDRAELRALIAGGYPIGVVELHRWQSPAVNRISERPQASPVSRYELGRAWAATTLWHDRFVIDDPVARQLVIELDGTNDRQQLIERLAATIKSQEKTATSSESHWPQSTDNLQLATRLDIALKDLAFSAMLIG